MPDRADRPDAAPRGFPDDFVWGVASSAYQIEGAVAEDGRGPSVWDHFCRRPGAVREGHTGAVACDHYHRLDADLDMIAALGVGAYRLSIAWPRVIPQGTGPANPAGLDFYDRLIDGLLARGVTPWVTLFHWDYPLELYWRGGWLNRDSVGWFADYSAAVARRLGDRVRDWMTLNEPQCFIGLGHSRGAHAPGLQMQRADVLRATHHALMAHGASVQAIRAHAPLPARVGWAPVGWVTYPDSDDPEVVEAARQAMFNVPSNPAQVWTFNNAWYSDPVCLGRYPAQGLAAFGPDVPDIRDGDMALIHQPIDFYGVNIYHGVPMTDLVHADHDGAARQTPRIPGHPETLMGWTVDPPALYWGPRFLAERYDLPIHVTENGIAALDWVHHDGRVDDPARVDYLTRHLFWLREAIRDGVNIRSYFQWSIMDNFEWELGYSKRFGLVYVDYASLERIPKRSYHWYAQVARSNGASLPNTLAPLR